MNELIIKLWKNHYTVSEIAFFTQLTCKEVIEVITERQPIDYINESYR